MMKKEQGCIILKPQNKCLFSLYNFLIPKTKCCYSLLILVSLGEAGQTNAHVSFWDSDSALFSDQVLFFHCKLSILLGNECVYVRYN